MEKDNSGTYLLGSCLLVGLIVASIFAGLAGLALLPFLRAECALEKLFLQPFGKGGCYDAGESRKFEKDAFDLDSSDEEELQEELNATSAQSEIVGKVTLTVTKNKCAEKGSPPKCEGTIYTRTIVKEPTVPPEIANYYPANLNEKFMLLYDSDAATREELLRAIANMRLERSKREAMIKLVDPALEAAQKYHLNPVYILAHAALESAYGTSSIARSKNNYFGYGAVDCAAGKCAWTFLNPRIGILSAMALIKARYLTPGGKYYKGPTLQKMGRNYASDPLWATKISQIMRKFYLKMNKKIPYLLLTKTERPKTTQPTPAKTGK
jgi:flagellum-specific peptidoglycan hydrolase FlgJ